MYGGGPEDQWLNWQAKSKLCSLTLSTFHAQGAAVAGGNDIVALRQAQAGTLAHATGLMVKNGWKILARTAALMPVSLLRMRISTRPGPAWVLTVGSGR